MKRNEYNTALVRNKKSGRMETICLDTGEVLQEVDFSQFDKYRFNFDMALLICQKVREGYTLKKINDDPNLPSLTVIHYWRRTNATFDEEIKLARKERAEYYHDKVLELADNTEEKEEVFVNKFKADQYKWAAEKGDPGTYGNKIEHTGNANAGSIVVITGIERSKPDVEVEYEEKDVQSPRARQSILGSGRSDVLKDDEEEAAETSGTGRDKIPPQ